MSESIPKEDLDILTASQIISGIGENFPPFVDSLSCEYKLPFPENSTLNDMDWDDFTFLVQKIFPEKPPTEYQISEAGIIYEVFYKGDDDGYEIQQAEITRELNFFAIRREDEMDYSLEFLAIFYKGELKEIELVSFEESSRIFLFIFFPSSLKKLT